MPFDTPLSPNDEIGFQQWKQRMAPQDSGADYDLRGAYQAGLIPSGGHWPDTYKKPNHPTFSDQPIYSSLTGTRPGTWEGENYRPFGYADQPHPFWKALEGVVNSFRGMQTSKAPWGMHEPTVMAGAGVERGLQAADDILGDPRNAWLGLGPLAGMARFRRVPHFGQDTGGFNVPTSRMLKQDTGMARTPELWEQDKRADYFFGRRLENEMATALQDETHEFHREAIDRYKSLMPEDRLRVDKVMKGQAILEGEKAKTRASTAGGAVPPNWFTPKDANQLANELDMKKRQDAYRRWTERGE